MSKALNSGFDKACCHSYANLRKCLPKALDVTASQRRTMAVETRQHIEDNFSTGRMCNSTIAIYARLLKNRHAAARGDHQRA